MTEITIKPKIKLKYRVDMSFLSKIQDYKSIREFLATKISYGNKLIDVSSLFKITGSNMSKVVIKSAETSMDNIGKGLMNIDMTVHGNVGFSFGSNMISGKLTLHGNCLDYAASGIKGGKIFIYGNTGNYFAGKPNSSNEGILDGFIYIKGNVGHNSIQRMRRGNVIISGNIGDYACAEMISGSVVVMGSIGKFFAEGIKRGTIITKDKKLTKNYRVANNAEYNFVDFFINSITEQLDKNIFKNKTIISRYHGHKNKENVSEVFLLKS